MIHRNTFHRFVNKKFKYYIVNYLFLTKLLLYLRCRSTSRIKKPGKVIKIITYQKWVISSQRIELIYLSLSRRIELLDIVVSTPQHLLYSSLLNTPSLISIELGRWGGIWRRTRDILPPWSPRGFQMMLYLVPRQI